MGYVKIYLTENFAKGENDILCFKVTIMKFEKLLDNFNIKNKTLNIYVILFNAFVLFCTVLFLVPTAVSNDDYLIHMITSGAYSEHSAFVVLSNYFFLSFLSFLQSTVGVFNFLTLSQYLFLFISFCLVGFVFLQKQKNFIGVLLYIGFILVFGTDFYNNIHNTKSAIFIAFCSLVSIYLGTITKSKTIVVLGCFGAVFSALIRISAFFMGGLFAFVFVVFFLLLNDNSKTLKQKAVNFLRLGTPYYITFAVILTLFIGDRIVYASNDDAVFYEKYNSARAELMDYDLPPYAENKQYYEDIGISENDHKLISVWAFSEADTFDIQTLISIGEITNNQNATTFFSNLGGQALSLIKSIPFIMFVSLFIGLFVFNTKQGKLLLLAFPLALIVVIVLTSFIGRMTPWVLSGLISCSVGLLLLLIDFKAVAQRFKKASIYLSCIIAVTSCVYAVTVSVPEVGTPKEHFKTEVMDIYSTLNSTGNLYLVDLFSTERIEIQHVISPFYAVPFDYYKNIYSLGNWDTESPAKNSVLERHNIEGSAYLSLVETNDVFLVDVMYYNEKLTYLKENVSEDVTFSIFDVVDGFFVFGFTNEAPTPTKQGVSIDDILVQSSSLLPEFANVVLKTDSIIAEHEMIFLEVTNVDNPSEKLIYKSKILSNENGVTTISLDVPYIDFNLFGSNYTANLIVQYDDGSVSKGTNDIQFII